MRQNLLWLILVLIVGYLSFTFFLVRSSPKAHQLGLMADCDKNNPNVPTCQAGLQCQLDHCLPPNAECGVSTDCTDPQNRCNVKDWTCEPAGCEDKNDTVGWCDQLTNDQYLDKCVPLNEEPAGTPSCCDEDADCPLEDSNNNVRCNMQLHLCMLD